MINSPHVIWKNSLFAIAILAGFNSSAGFSIKEDLGLVGSVRAAHWDRDKSFTDNKNYLVSGAWFTLQPKEILETKIFLDAYVQGQDLSRDNMSYGELREFYVSRTFSNLDVKIGRFINVWGRADKVNPTDSFSVRNFKLLSTDDEDQRRGKFATQLVYNLDSLRIFGLWEPEWISPTFPVADSGSVKITEVSPKNVGEQYGFKIDQSGGAVDWSISYFEGLSKTPDISFVSFTGGQINLAATYNKVQVYGADMAMTISDFGVRSEIAYTKTIDDTGRDLFLQNSSLFYVLGTDTAINENFSLNAQVLYRHIYGFTDPDAVTDPTTKLLAQQQAVTSSQLAEDQYGFSVRPSYKMWNDTFELETAYVVWFNFGDHLIRPKLTYAFNDHTKFIVGGEFYNGNSQTFFGRLKDVSSAFTEIRLYF
jgi:hypothetical protein